jgi:hypothetical protein
LARIDESFQCHPSSPSQSPLSSRSPPEAVNAYP